MVNIIVESFFDKKTNAVSYVVFSKDSRAGIIIDPILDLNIENYSIKTKSADNILNFINKNNIKIYWILETHIHADHLTAAKYLKYKTGGSIAISCNVIEVQKRLVSVFNLYITPNFSHLSKYSGVGKLYTVFKLPQKVTFLSV